MNLVIWLLCSLSLSVGYARISLPFFKLGATATASASASASSSSNDKLFKPSFESDSEEETQLFPSQANCELKIDVVGDAAPTVFRFEINKATKETKTCWRNGVATWPLCKEYSTFSIWKYVNNATFSRCTMPTYCEPEHFHHFYERRGGKLQHFNNRWKRAKVGERVGLHEICLKANGLPLTRMCLFDEKQQLPVWENIEAWPQIVCLNETREKIITPQLNMLHDEMLDGKLPKNTTLQRHNILSRIHTLLSEPNYKHLPADVHLTRQILVSVMEDDSAKDAANAPDIFEICKDIMFMDSMVLRMSAKGLNATNGLLDTFESYMDALTPQIIPQSHCGIKSPNITQLINQTLPKTVEILDQSDLGVYGLLSANLSVYFVNPRCSQISGIAIYNPHTKVSKKPLKHSADNSFLYRFVYTNESAENLLQESGLEIAAFLPLSLWQKLETNATLLPVSHTLLVFKVYAHDGLFVENAQLQSRKPFSKVLSISIPGFHGHLPEEFPFILRNNHPPPANGAESRAPQGTGCGYWNYDTWVSDGVQTIASKLPPNKQQKDLILCRTNHLTSFSYLLGGSYKQSDLGSDVLITPLHQQVLDIISIIGCSLSLLGLLAIWLTAALFKNWRSQASTKVLLNLCLALTLQMTLFVFVNTDDMSEHLIQERSYINCIALGAALQYSILVLFSWMLIAAFLQFQRYVTVLGIQRPTHYILKSAVAAWGFPLIPTLLVAFIDPHSYIPNDYQLNTDTGICYPSGHGLLFGVIIPVALIVIANFTIFIYVCWSISYTLSQSMQRHERKLIMKQIRLSVLLFFLLGLTWIFGILAFMRAGIVFSYLFCLTATMQGFVLFIYFVVLDKTTQNAWFDLLCPKVKDSNTNKTSELQSITSTGSTTAGVSSEVSKTANKP